MTIDSDGSEVTMQLHPLKERKISPSRDMGRRSSPVSVAMEPVADAVPMAQERG